jgi:hypothetical protein
VCLPSTMATPESSYLVRRPVRSPPRFRLRPSCCCACTDDEEVQNIKEDVKVETERVGGSVLALELPTPKSEPGKLGGIGFVFIAFGESSHSTRQC